MIARLHELQIAAPFGVGRRPTITTDRRHRHVYAGGLGLPDRDYYLKPEKRFVERARSTASTSRRCSSSPAPKAGRGEEGATTVFASRSAWPRRSLDNVALRDPKLTDHKMTVARCRR
jgi:putative endopeptidase